MDNVGEVPDHTLWRRAAAGDGDAFGCLFERHASRIYNYCFRRTGDWARAEDLTSATFLVAWKSCRRSPLQSESALPLLYGIATNVLRNQRRSLKRGREAFARLPLPRLEEPDFADDTAERLDDSRKMHALLALFSQLPRREQDVIALCDWSDLSYDDTAAALGVPIGTVRSRLARGRDRLRELAGANGPERDVNVVPRPIEVNKQ
jgi:RNA polymerase sigma-70 factor (ECF subfamily)